MQLSQILAEIDKEILAGDSSPSVKSSRRGTSAVSASESPAKRKKKRNLSPEGRKRIAEAVRRRWELQKKAAAK
jgi:hypothetical protein